MTVIVQQIHSLRANGVRLFHTPTAAGVEASAFFKSTGIWCTVPPGIAFLAIVITLHYYKSASAAKKRELKLCTGKSLAS